MFATYNPSTYQLTGFFLNQPLNDFVVLDIATRNYILENELNHQVFFQDIRAGMEITQANILLKDAQTLENPRKPVSVQISELQEQVNLLATQVLALTLSTEISTKGIPDATK